MSSSSAAFSLDHIATSPSEQLCYVHCNFCDTVLAVSVPCSSLFKTVTVRCGHCTNLLSVNMRTLLFPAPTQIQFAHNLLAPTHHTNLLEEIICPPPPPPPPPSPSLLPTILDPHHLHHQQTFQKPPSTKRTTDADAAPQTPLVNRPPEKRQRVPSAYNRFIKDEIQRIKAGNPDITHREAFSAAAKNWAHFPHIHFGLMPDHGLKKNNIRQQEGEEMMLKDGLYAAAAANIGITPF